jgi:hypothetical protein
MTIYIRFKGRLITSGTPLLRIETDGSIWPCRFRGWAQTEDGEERFLVGFRPEGAKKEKLFIYRPDQFDIA